MALLDLINLSKSYEANTILKEINFSISECERVAVIAKNGGGKSTFMKIVAGILEFDDGRRIVQNSIKIEMLDQNPIFEDNLTVKEAVENELKELKNAKERFESISLLLSKDFENSELLREHAKLSAFLDAHNAWNLDDKIERILQEFALKEYEDTRILRLSGGEQRRVALAGLLLKKPDILLLDEPTNHLDVYMVEFLERYILRERFTLLFISHDRYFIDNIASRCIEIEDSKIRFFKGGYSDYISQKEELLKSMQKSHEVLLKLLKSEEEWLNRGVKARLKRNEGRKQRVLKMREEAKKNPSVIRKMKLELQREQKNFQNQKSLNKKKMLFEIDNIGKSLGEKVLIKDFTLRILQQDKIAIVGKNGAGKSTLLKLLLGELQIDSGGIKRGDFKIGYFDQQRRMLDDDKNLIETFCPNGGDRVLVRGKNMHVYGYLKNFLFPKEHLDKKVGILSGGEKNRVALALLFAKEYDCLILDEPTNDLDIATINILEEYLQNFNGALIFVSHDRYFVDKIARKLLIFKGEGVVEESYQSYSEYLEIEKELNEIENFCDQSQSKQKDQNRVKKRSLKLSYKEKRDYERLPQKIEAMEDKIKELNDCLGDPSCYKQRGIENLHKELLELNRSYEEMVERYLLIEEKIEDMGGGD